MPYTVHGEKLLRRLMLAYRPLRWLRRKSWETPKKNFEENPRLSPYVGAAYLGYKYYIAPPLRAQGGLEQHFRKQELDFTPPAEFVSEQQLTLSAGGDLMPYERVNAHAARHLWDEVGDWFFDADLVVANLETPVDLTRPAAAVPEIMLNDMHFNGSEELFGLFSGNGRFKGYDVLSTANNHSLDQGEEGLFRTMEFLRNKGVTYCGSACSQEESQAPVIVARNGIRVGFLSWTSNLNKFVPEPGREWAVNYDRLNGADPDLSAIRRQVEAARNAGADITVFLFHTGNAYQAYPSAHTVHTFHRVFSECGVDVILGSHPHNPQPMEKVAYRDPISGEDKTGFAIYSLADFVAYDIFVWDRLVPLLKLTIEKGTVNGRPKTLLTQVRVLPVYNWGTKPAHGGREEMRFLDLKKTVRLVEDGLKPDFLSDVCVQELRHLNWFCDRHFLPEQKDYLLATASTSYEAEWRKSSQF